MPDALRFAPQLFEQRNIALEVLEDAGFTHFADFRSVDLDHKYYGVTIVGVADRATAKRILAALSPCFPGWPHRQVSRCRGGENHPYRVEFLRDVK